MADSVTDEDPAAEAAEATPKTQVAPTPGTKEARKEARKALFDAKVEEMRGREAPKSTFADSLETEGVEAKVTQKEGAGEKTSVKGSPEPVDEPKAADGESPADAPKSDDSGQAAILDAVAPDTREENRTDHMARRDALQKRGEDAGLPVEIAKALAGNVPRKVAESYLEEREAAVDSAAAGQSGQAAVDPEGAPATVASSEVQRLLSLEVGEETATAVAGAFANLEARLARSEAMSEQSFQAVGSAAREQAQGALSKATGELSGDFPGLVRDGVLDPQVGQMAAAFIKNEVFPRGDVKGALQAACRARFGGDVGETQDRQQSPQTTPEVDVPTRRDSLPGHTITREQTRERLTAVSVKNASNPKRASLVQAEAAKIARHNERMRIKG